MTTAIHFLESFYLNIFSQNFIIHSYKLSMRVKTQIHFERMGVYKELGVCDSEYLGHVFTREKSFTRRVSRTSKIEQHASSVTVYIIFYRETISDKYMNLRTHKITITLLLSGAYMTPRFFKISLSTRELQSLNFQLSALDVL